MKLIYQLQTGVLPNLKSIAKKRLRRYIIPMGKASTQASREKVAAIASAILDEKFRTEKPQIVEALVERMAVFGGTKNKVWAGVLTPAERKGLQRVQAKAEAVEVNSGDDLLPSASLALINEAIRVFGEEKIAKSWLKHPRRQFGGKSPHQMLKTTGGRKAVAELLGQIDHGIYG